MKIIVNDCFGGWSISEQAFKDLQPRIPEMKDTHCDHLRTHPILIDYLEKHGTKATSGKCAELHVIEIPDDVRYDIEDYDGIETIHEVHRTWCYDGGDEDEDE